MPHSTQLGVTADGTAANADTDLVRKHEFFFEKNGYKTNARRFRHLHFIANGFGLIPNFTVSLRSTE